MKLLFVFNIGFDRAGPSVHLLKDIMTAALDHGHQCHVICKQSIGRQKTGLEALTAGYQSLTVTPIVQDSAKKKGFVKRYLADCRYARKCKKYYAKNKYDAVFLQSCNVGWVYMQGLRRLHCPVIFNIQDIFPQNLMFSGQLPFSQITYPLFLWLQSVAYRKATKLITISEDMKETLVKQGIDREKIEVIYNWSYADTPIRLSDMPVEHIYDLKADPNKTNVVYAGNIGKMQNVELLAKTAAFSREDDTIHYYIIGAGANTRHIKAMTQGLSNVTILPMQPAIYAESIYAQADINVIPLVRGGIQTAMPSKTATVLRTDTFTVFCIDADSKWEEKVQGDPHVYLADHTDPASLYRVICNLRACREKKQEKSELLSLFSKKNAERYVEMMEDTAINGVGEMQ